MATNTGNVGQHKRSPMSSTKNNLCHVKSGGASGTKTGSKKGSIWKEK